MIYKTLRTLPMVTLIEIIETGDISLLSDESIPIEELVELWEIIFEDYKNRFDSDNTRKIFNLSKEIEYLEQKYLIIKMSIEALKFEVNDDLIQILNDYGYSFDKSKYFKELEKIDRESKGIEQKISLFKSQLPQQSEEKKDQKQSNSIINIMAGYAAILGFDFDFYSISVEKYYSLENQVKSKITAIEKQNSKK
jgi:hypothetical protein